MVVVGLGLWLLTRPIYIYIPQTRMEACNEVVDQLRALDEAEARVEEYRRHYLERGQALVQDKDAWIKTWHAKVRMVLSSGLIISGSK